MPAIDDETRLHHMLEAALKAVAMAEGQGRDELDRDEKLALALTRLVEIVGEASKHVSEAVRLAHAEVAWRPIAGMRDKLTHGYFDLDILWAVVSTDLPRLIAQLQAILPPEPPAP